MTDRTVAVKLRAETAQYMAGMRQATKGTADFGRELSKAAKGGQLDHVADMATGAGIALVGAFAGVVAITAKFDKQMSEVGAVSGATAGQLDQLRQAALDAGKATSFSATEAAKAEAELAKAGLSTSQILGGGLAGSLSLAAAGTLDLAEAATIAAKTMNVFQLEGKDVGHIADVLAASANKSATDVHEMGEALKQGGLAASSAGMSLEETVGTLSAFADRALSGSDAGTSLKTAIMMLQAPTAKAQELMDKLGISAYDASGQFVGTAKLAGILQTQLAGMTQQQRNAALATIFGADAMRAANVLFAVGEKGIRDYTAAVDDQGAAAEVAAKKMDNLAGDIERLKGSLETLAIESGSGANSGLRSLVQIADDLVAQFSSLNPMVQSGAVVFAGISGALLLGLAAWVRSRRAMADVRLELEAMGPAGARASAGMSRLTLVVGRLGAAFAALQILDMVIGKFQKDLNPQVDAMSKGLEEYARSGKLAGEASRVLGDDLDDLAVGLKFLADTDNTRRQWARGLQDSLESFTPGLRGTDTSLARTRERVNALDSALAQLVQGGQINEARTAFDRLTVELAKDGVSVDELTALFPQYAGAVESAGKASTTAAGGINAVGGAAGDAEKQVQDLKDAFDRLFGIQKGYDEAALALAQGAADIAEAFGGANDSIATNTQRGRDNRKGVLDQITAIEDMRAATIERTDSIDAGNKLYQDELTALGKSLIAKGADKRAVWELIDAYRNIPGRAATEVSAPGADTSKKKVQDFNFEIGQVKPRKAVKIDAVTDEANNDIRATQRALAALHDKTIHVRVLTSGTGEGAAHGFRENRRGGIYTHAATGLLRDAAMFAPTTPAAYAFAEPSTGGEAFIPRQGDMSRSRGIAETVVRDWLGGQVRWPGESGGSAAAVTYDNSLHIHPEKSSYTAADASRDQRRQESRSMLGRRR